MATNQGPTVELPANVSACFAKLVSRTPIIGRPVSLTERGTEWTRWYLYADAAMTTSIGTITLKLRP